MANEQEDVASRCSEPEQIAAGSHMTTVKLPPFWHRSPAWYRIIEALFILKGVKDNVECYYQVMAALIDELVDMWGNITGRGARPAVI
jgi:hypothetical protein